MIKLTEDDIQKITHIANGLNCSQIAEKYGLTSIGVRQRMDKIRKMMSASNHAHMVAISIKDGLVDSGSIEALGAGALTECEKAVFELLKFGMSNNEIRYETGTSIATVKAHVSSIMKKTGCTSRARVVAYANNAGARA